MPAEPPVEPAMLGERCDLDDDCLSGTCLTSQFGTPFCTRTCERAFEACDSGPDLLGGQQALCLDFSEPPNPRAPAFEGKLNRFCAPRCTDSDSCDALDPIWEVCDIPRWHGDPLASMLGNQRVCQSPSFHGKPLVDPETCSWEHTIDPSRASEANLCRAYCRYLATCDALSSDAPEDCCAWGCYNATVTNGGVQPAWRDEVRCYTDSHATWPAAGSRNRCTEPPLECGGPPSDPTPPAAMR